VILAVWFGMTILGFIAIGIIDNPNLPQGNPRKLLNAVDYQGRVCGYDSLKHLPYGYYLLDRTVVCVDKCPTTTDYYSFICQYDKQANASSSLYLAAEYVVDGSCFFQFKSSNCKWGVSSVSRCSFINSCVLCCTADINRCIPDAAVDLAEQTFSSVNVTYGQSTSSYNPKASEGWFSDFLHDVYKMSGIVFGIGLGVSTAIAFLYLCILRIPGCLFISIWGVILAVQAALIVGAFLLWSTANEWYADRHSSTDSHTFYQIKGAYILSYIAMGFAFLYFCLMLVLRSRVQLAIGVIQEAAKALKHMQLLLLSPVLQVFGLCVFMVPWIIYVIYLASSGTMQVHTGTQTINGSTQSYTYRTFEYTVNTKYAFLYMIFCYYWTSEFITACGQMFVALSFACWYFTRDKSTTGTRTVMWVSTLFDAAAAAAAAASVSSI
jgi:hypothetical protein